MFVLGEEGGFDVGDVGGQCEARGGGSFGPGGEGVVIDPHKGVTDVRFAMGVWLGAHEVAHHLNVPWPWLVTEGVSRAEFERDAVMEGHQGE